jgi:hypothetical protein
MKAVEDNDTWELTSLPAGHRAIGLKWDRLLSRWQPRHLADGQTEGRCSVFV